MNEIVIAVVGGFALFLLTSFVGLAVWAINAKIEAARRDTIAAQNEAALREENERLKLETRIAKDLVEPAIVELRELVRHLEGQMNLRNEVRGGFEAVQATFDERLPIKGAPTPIGPHRPGSRA